jgi:hypothetical protein
MSTFIINDIRSIGRAATEINKTASVMLNKAVKAQSTTRSYDIFLSHSFNDAELILGLKIKLERYGNSVYVDWLDDPQLDRNSVTPATANQLRDRMNCCRSLFYATTKSSSQSKWMPWECGYIDGKVGLSAILPLTESKNYNYTGQEYLGIYPYITEETIKGTTTNILWVNQSNNVYCKFSEWLAGQKPYEHN